MHQIDQDFVYNRFPKNEHDVQLLDDYWKSLKGCELMSDSQLLDFFPVDDLKNDEIFLPIMSSPKC
jgi:hypothetical protein